MTIRPDARRSSSTRSTSSTSWPIVEETGVDIPDRDVASLTTLDAFVDRPAASPLAR